jgi:pimeloyl-ACP methyl ester carboxylesterase
VTARRATGFIVTAVALGGCGGGDGGRPSGSGTKATPRPSATRAVTASVDGRKLSGHCRGTQRQGSPAILLESGMGGGQTELAGIEAVFADRTLVCSYDRAGTGGSDAAAHTPRPISELVADLDAFAGSAQARPPYVLVGQSMGGNVVLMYAQAHPEKVAGFVSINPVPPAETWLKAAKKVMTEQELAEEQSFYRGENVEFTSFREPVLSRPLPPEMPYAVMFDEDCDGDAGFCDRILPPLTATTRSLAALGDRGRFVRAKGAGHDIPGRDPALVRETIDRVLRDAR